VEKIWRGVLEVRSSVLGVVDFFYSKLRCQLLIRGHKMVGLCRGGKNPQIPIFRLKFADPGTILEYPCGAGHGYHILKKSDNCPALHRIFKPKNPKMHNPAPHTSPQVMPHTHPLSSPESSDPLPLPNNLNLRTSGYEEANGFASP